MSKLTPELRERLDEEIDPLTKSIDLLETQIKPVVDAIRLLADQRDAILERYGLDDTFNELRKCESCGAYITDGDMAFHYEDGPSFCVEHAPTWSETEKQLIELLATGELDNEDTEATEASLARVRAIIAEGRGHEKNVW